MLEMYKNLYKIIGYSTTDNGLGNKFRKQGPGEEIQKIDEIQQEEWVRLGVSELAEGRSDVWRGWSTQLVIFPVFTGWPWSLRLTCVPPPPSTYHSPNKGCITASPQS